MNQGNYRYWTALHMAALNGNLKNLRLIIANGARDSKAAGLSMADPLAVKSAKDIIEESGEEEVRPSLIPQSFLVFFLFSFYSYSYYYFFFCCYCLLCFFFCCCCCLYACFVVFLLFVPIIFCKSPFLLLFPRLVK